jgi:hypothetical protein
MADLVVSLTTIPSRAKYLSDFMVRLERQRVQPSRIEINIPFEYTKRNMGMVDESLIPSDIDIYYCDDFGPATKILPTLKRYDQQDVNIIYCDDDKIYHENWIKNLTLAAEKYPGSAICDECVSVRSIINRYHNPRKNYYYKLRKILSIGKYRPYRTDKKTEAEIVQGFGGVLVKPNFFHHDVFVIPCILWAVDDIWLSCNLTVNGTNIRWSERGKDEKSRPIINNGINIGDCFDALNLTEFSGMDRFSLDYYAVRYLQKRFGIWQKYE